MKIDVFFLFLFLYFVSVKEKKNVKYIEISEKVSNMLKKKFNSELTCNKRYLKADKSRLSMFICTNNVD